MARAKFLCDAERCIECNACVTACKNEHEVPWGVNRRGVQHGAALDLLAKEIAHVRCEAGGGARVFLLGRELGEHLCHCERALKPFAWPSR